MEENVKDLIAEREAITGKINSLMPFKIGETVQHCYGHDVQIRNFIVVNNKIFAEVWTGTVEIITALDYLYR